MDIATLSATAKALVAPGKGILAADESSGTIKKRFDSISVESTEDNRRDYREMLFTAEGRRRLHQRRHPLRRDHPPGRGRRHAAGRSCSRSQGIIPGIKVDLGAKPLPFADGETVTEGLDGLRERLAEYQLARRALRQVARDVHDHRRRCRARTAST